jgi:hypothetical protein
MESLKLPTKFNLQETNLTEPWKKFKRNFEIYCTALGEELTQGGKCELLLHALGDECIDIHSTFDFTPNEHNKFEILIKKFDEYFLPKRNITFERYKFFSRNQELRETIENDIRELKILSSTCEFETLKESLIRDRIVGGINSEQIRSKLLQEEKLTLKKCIEICKMIEMTKSQMQQMNSGTENNHINEITSKKKMTSGASGKSQPRSAQKQEKSQREINNCTCCGRNHKINECPAFEKECRKCGKLKHFANMCKQKEDSKKEDPKNHQKKSVKEISARNSASKNQESASDSDNSEFTIASVGNEKKTAKDQEDWTAKIQVLENPNVTIKFKLDTGAQVNLIPKRLFDKIPDKDSFLKQSKIKLLNYSGNSITILGKCTFRCKVNQGENNCQLDFFIVETDKNAPAILGLYARQKLKLIERVNSVNSLTDILNDYKEVFSGSGCFGSPQNIVLQENAQPVVHNTRKIPLTLKSELKAELNRLERFKMIEKVNEPTDWVNPLVLVRKPPGKLRICFDPKQLNKYIKRQHYQVPLIEELLTELNGATVFSRVDADQGFYQTFK